MAEEYADIILIVDDNPTNLRVLVDYLQTKGYKTLVATSGERAIQQLERHTPDLILLDVMMPGIDGFETCARIKANPATAEIPVIFMTALTDVEHKVAGFEAGAVDYITKPFQHAEVSARVNTHLMMQRQKRALAELNATKDKFFSVIGHDLRGPFTVLLGFSEIFADPERELSKQQRLRFGQLIHQSARNAYNLLENLLDWARLQRGVIEFDPIYMELAHTVDEAFQLLRYSAEMKNVTMSHDIDPALKVLADPNMLSTIVRNLLSNAIKFTDAEGSVSVSATVTGTMICVAVKDTGIGIAPQDQDKILGNVMPLSTQGTRGEHGTGLGLILCREFISRHGGKLSLNSMVDEGSTFTFTLPMQPAQDAAADSQPLHTTA